MVRYIRGAQRRVTILFTDIEGSTKYWDTHGDIQGRLMVDQHNRLIFPVVRKFRGKVVKTIGDSVMATFKRPRDAVKAAIGIQQILDQARQTEEGFSVSVRIGLHTGQAVVEKGDVFGDVVNVAARVRDEAKGGEILVSKVTRDGLSRETFDLIAGGAFHPKGKSELMHLFRCRWQGWESLVDDIEPGSYLPIMGREKLAILLNATVIFATLYFLHLRYFRYLLTDSKHFAILALNPHLFVVDHPILAGFLGMLAAGVLALLIWLRISPPLLLRLLRGGFAFGVAFISVFLTITYLTGEIFPALSRPMWESEHLFVTVLENDSNVHAAPAFAAPVVMTANAGDILLQVDVARRFDLSWNKVYLGGEKAGWIARNLPARVGIPAKKITNTDKFYFRRRDLFALLVATVAFAWRAVWFKLSPV